MIPGIGIGIGFASRPVFTAAALHAALSEIHGAALVGLVLADDATLSGTDATAITARVGGNATAWAPYPTRVLAGRRYLYSNSITDKGLIVSPSAAARTVFAIGSCAPLPPSGYPFLLYGPNGSRFYLPGDLGVSTWRTTSADLTGTRYDGTANTETISAGLRCWSYTEAIGGSTFWVGGYQGFAASWSGLIGALVFVSGAVSADTRARTLSAAKRYYPSIVST